jgi:MinD superfamily P-loop ATPase
LLVLSHPLIASVKQPALLFFKKNMMMKPFKIAVASGKGGTGKTTVAANLAATLAGAGRSVRYLDCDVEEPNGHIFLKPVIAARQSVTVSVPEVVEEKCSACRICASVCEYKAIAFIKDTVLIFPELCHSCGACILLCPENAFVETPREVGDLETGAGCGVSFVQGRLHIGQVAAPAVIKAVKNAGTDDEIIILDCPPGTSCNVIEAVKDADLVILVTEPTPFGLNDLKLAVEMTRALDMPFGVIVNRHDMGDDSVIQYCVEENIPVIIKIPDDRRIAESYARGALIVQTAEKYRQIFEYAWERITQCQGRAKEDIVRRQKASGSEAAP